MSRCRPRRINRRPEPRREPTEPTARTAATVAAPAITPPTDAEIEFHAKLLKQVIDENWAFIAEREGETVGVALTLPDINQVLAKMGGRLLPFGWLRFLLGKRRIDRVRVFALGVKNDFRHGGVAAGLYLRHLEEASPDGVPAGETGWILETNEPMNRAMEGMGGEIVKRYRIYGRAL